MIFFLNQNGTCTRQDTDHIYQGSNNASKVIAITSVAPIQTFVQVAFTLPNSLTYGYLPMAYKGAYQVGGDTDNQMHLYELDLPYNVTEVQGEVGVSFNVVNSVTGANMTSYTNTFTVEYSALPIPPASASESELEQILNLLNAYYAQNTGIITTHTSQIQAIQTEQTTQNNAISTLQAQSTSLQQAVTKNASDIAGIKTEQSQQNEEIEKLKEASVIGETPVGTLPSSGTMPTDADIQTYYSQNVGREPRVGDVFFFTQILPSGYKVYKYIYGATGWAYYEIPGANVGSNPNMARNSNFAINQRGQTKYVGAIYGVDGWRGNMGTTIVQVNANGGVIVSGVNFQFIQYIEMDVLKDCVGKTLTLSLSSNGVIYSGQQVNMPNVSEDYAGISIHLSNNCNMRLRKVGNGNLFIQIVGSANGDSLQIDWVKLELGEVSTTFTPPNPSEELSKCQRYYVDMCYQVKSNLSPYMVGSGLCNTATLAYFVVPIPTSMRISTAQVSPIYDIEKLTVLSGGSTLSITALDIVGSNNTSITVRATGSFEIGNAALLRIKAGENGLGILAFDAEI